MFKSNTEVVLDIETTGLYFQEGHKIIEIAAIKLCDKRPSGEFFHRYINPERDIPEESIKIHGITNQFILNKPIFSEIALELSEFLGQNILIAHNASFDINFINFELEQNFFPKLNNQIIDTLLLAKKKIKKHRHNLDALCSFYGINLSKRNTHGALVDAELLAQVYYFLSIDESFLSDALEMTEEAEFSFINRASMSLTAEEEEAHFNLINSINGNLF